MKPLGIALWLSGAGLIAYAMFVFDASVEGGMFGGRVVNLALQQQQMMMTVCGAALFVAGEVLHTFAVARPRAAAAQPTDKRSWWRAYRDEVARLGAEATDRKKR